VKNITVRSTADEVIKKFVHRQGGAEKAKRRRSYLRRAAFEHQRSMRAKFADKNFGKKFVLRQGVPQKSKRQP